MSAHAPGKPDSVKDKARRSRERSRYCRWKRAVRPLLWPTCSFGQPSGDQQTAHWLAESRSPNKISLFDTRGEHNISRPFARTQKLRRAASRPFTFLKESCGADTYLSRADGSLPSVIGQQLQFVKGYPRSIACYKTTAAEGSSSNEKEY